MIFLVSEITQIVHINMKAISEVELGSSFSSATEHCIAVSASQRERN